MNILTAEVPTPSGMLWIGGDAERITEISWQPIAGRAHGGKLDWFLEALEGYLLRRLKTFPGGLGFAGQRPLWFKTAPNVTSVTFPQKTYQAMCAIRYGQTKSYADLGEALGNRSLARAVGNVCAANRVPIVVPCHRVVGAHSLGGYTGGIDKKRWLLTIEESTETEK